MASSFVDSGRRRLANWVHIGSRCGVDGHIVSDLACCGYLLIFLNFRDIRAICLRAKLG